MFWISNYYLLYSAGSNAFIKRAEHQISSTKYQDTK